MKVKARKGIKVVIFLIQMYPYDEKSASCALLPSRNKSKKIYKQEKREDEIETNQYSRRNKEVRTQREKERGNMRKYRAHSLEKLMEVKIPRRSIVVCLLSLPVKGSLNPLVKYGGRSPKFIWAPCHVMCTAVLIG